MRQRRKNPLEQVDAQVEERAFTNFPILRELSRIASEVPRESWDRLPRDLSSNLDHYVYGSPKQ